MPKFQKKFPKNALDYFDPASDEEFKQKHPVGYGVLVACGIGALILPMVIMLLLTMLWCPVEGSGWLFLVMVGCFIMGIGLFNIVAAWINQYLGHWVTIGCLLVGGILAAIGLAIIYNPDIYALFDERMTSYFFFSLIFAAVPPIYYAIFRFTLEEWLRSKRISHTKIKKLKKGKKNYWWYEALHKQYNLGLIYYVNKWFTVLYVAHLALLFGFGWFRFASPVIAILYAIVCLLAAGMSLFSSAQNNVEEFGTPIVIFRIRENKGWASSLLDLGVAAFPLMAGYAQIKVLLELLANSQ